MGVNLGVSCDFFSGTFGGPGGTSTGKTSLALTGPRNACPVDSREVMFERALMMKTNECKQLHATKVAKKSASGLFTKRKCPEVVCKLFRLLLNRRPAPWIVATLAADKEYVVVQGVAVGAWKVQHQSSRRFPLARNNCFTFRRCAARVSTYWYGVRR